MVECLITRVIRFRHKFSEQKRIVKSMPNTFFMKGDLSICINKSEMLFSLFFVERNVPLSLTNHVGHLFKTMFPDLKPPSNMLAFAQK